MVITNLRRNFPQCSLKSDVCMPQRARSFKNGKITSILALMAKRARARDEAQKRGEERRSASVCAQEGKNEPSRFAPSALIALARALCLEVQRTPLVIRDSLMVLREFIELTNEPA